MKCCFAEIKVNRFVLPWYTYHRNCGICKNTEVQRWFLQVLFASYVRGKWVLYLM